MGIWLDVLQAVAAIAGLVIGYISLSHQKRAEVRTVAIRWTAYSCAIGIVVVSVVQIVKFGTSDEPLTRKDVLWLLMNLWNALIYGHFGLFLAGYWIGKDSVKATNTQGEHGQ